MNSITSSVLGGSFDPTLLTPPPRFVFRLQNPLLEEFMVLGLGFRV